MTASHDQTTLFTLGASVTLLVASLTLVIATATSAQYYPWPTIVVFSINALIEFTLCLLVVEAFAELPPDPSPHSTERSSIIFN